MANVVSKETLVPLGTVIAVGALLFGLWRWLDGQFTTVRMDFAAVNMRLTAIETSASEQYTLTNAAEDALRNAIANPGMKFSDPRNPGEYIVVTVDAR